MARRFAQPRFRRAGATVNGFEAHGANPNVRFAGRRKFLPVTRALPAIDLLTTKNARHAMEVDGKKEKVKPGAYHSAETARPFIPPSPDWETNYAAVKISRRRNPTMFFPNSISVGQITWEGACI